MKAAANTITDITLELGGKSPLIVFPDADPAEAADIAVDAMFFNGGECCSAGTRLFIHESIADEFVDAILDAVGARMATRLSNQPKRPKVSGESKRRSLHRPRQGLDASVLRGGVTVEERILADGCFVEPTVIADVGADRPSRHRRFSDPSRSCLSGRLRRDGRTREQRGLRPRCR